MKPLTIKDLKKECDIQIKKGNGDKVIMISDDDEGNGYHYCWYSFTPAKDILDNDYMCNPISEDIATMEDTVILG